jgi:soluble lytic murein transglycosylase-like protein
LPGLKNAARQFAGSAFRFLRFSLAQMRGGRGLIKRGGVYYVPLWLPIALALLLMSSAFWGDIAGLVYRGAKSTIHSLRATREADLADFFAPAVQHWAGNISDWSAEHQVDPRLLATVMQIESCGHPTVISSAGARGLFQVMPFHFAEGEDMLDPDTNARRGSAFLKQCQHAADGVIGLALACYNGGASVLGKPRENWSRETQAYYRWGVGIYSDAVAGSATSDTFDQWLAAGGRRLCASAERELGF